MPANTLFNWSGGELDLVRFPLPRDFSLQAFSTADAYMLDHAAEHQADSTVPWVVNDAFGALSLALHGKNPHWVGGSWSARRAMELNAERNNLTPVPSIWLDDADWPANPGFIMIAVPKELDLLEYQLALISKHAPTGVPVIGGGMTRNIHTSTIQIFEKYLGDVASSLAWKKARLITGVTDGDKSALSPAAATYSDDKSGAAIVSMPGVFSGDHPDPGSSLLANALPPIDIETNVLDLGCGNGYLLAHAAKRNPSLKLFGCDDSRMAVNSTQMTLEANGFEGDIRHGHATADFEPASMDVVLCNPPFHQGHARHDQIAWDMFTGAKRVLKPGGTMFVVGNRNLGYHIQLSRIFRKVDIQASDTTYTVFRCQKATY